MIEHTRIKWASSLGGVEGHGTWHILVNKVGIIPITLLTQIIHFIIEMKQKIFIFLFFLFKDTKRFATGKEDDGQIILLLEHMTKAAYWGARVSLQLFVWKRISYLINNKTRIDSVFHELTTVNLFLCPSMILDMPQVN